MKETGHAAALSADMIQRFKDWVREDMEGDDVTAQELIEMLDLAWCAAERWRIERFDLLSDDDVVEETSPHASTFNA
jgi:hypothetical protein